MKYLIHGKTIIYNEELECGIYKKDNFGMDYAVMDPVDLVQRINSLPKEQVCASILSLRDMARAQSQWIETPKNIGHPILIGGPERTPINEVRGNIRNLESFCNEILNVLNP